LKCVQEQFFLAATAQNVKRLVRFLSTPTTGPETVPAQADDPNMNKLSAIPAPAKPTTSDDFFNTHRTMQLSSFRNGR
jgi:hypothetical protein